MNGDAIAVAARELRDGFIAGACEQGADGDARHVAVGAGSIYGVDPIADAGQHDGSVIDLLWVGGVWWVQFGGYRKTT